MLNWSAVGEDKYENQRKELGLEVEGFGEEEKGSQSWIMAVGQKSELWE